MSKKSMKMSYASIRNKLVIVSLGFLVIGQFGCESSSEEEENDGYVKFYNTSKNAPAIFLTIDEDLTTSDDDDIETTYSSVAYTKASGLNQLNADSYFFELAWQDGDSSSTNDLTTIFQSEIAIEKDTIQLVVLSEDVLEPAVMLYDIPVVEDDDDDTYDLFNLRVLNMSNQFQAVDVFLSKADESFNEAVLISQVSYQALSDNQKYDQEDYIFYVTEANNTEVLFQSTEISFSYSAQYIIALRENTGAGTSPFVIDKIANSSIVEYIDYQSEAQFQAYNAITTHENLPNYQQDLSFVINGVDEAPISQLLSFGNIESPVLLPSGDYSVDLYIPDSETAILSNHLLSLPENSNKTVFFYLEEEFVDDDNDGDVDENGDGIVDEIAINIHSLVVDNSVRESIYDHEIELVNLVDAEAFSLVTVYFVRQDETIETALYKSIVGFGDNESIYLQNNTYQVYVVAKDDSSDIILNAFSLTLDETSKEQFLVIEGDYEATEISTSMFNQISVTAEELPVE